MNILNPLALLWFLPAAGAIIALYLLKIRRRDLKIPAVFLWPQRTEEVRANALFQKLKFSWLLVLQLLLALLACVALARPQLRQAGLSGKVTIVVLDVSASMGATDVSPSRFEVAKADVKRMIGAEKSNDRLGLIVAGPHPHVAFPLESEPANQQAQLAQVQLTDAEGDMGEALRLAAAITSQIDGAKIVVLSDGAFEPVENFQPGKAELAYVKVGSSSENCAVSALGVTTSESGSLGYCGVKNYGLQPAKIGLTLFADGQAINSVSDIVAPGKVYGKSFSIPAGVKRIEAKLDNTDHLASDNYGVCLLGESASIRVLLISKGDMFLERALALDPRVLLEKSTQVPVTELSSSREPSAYDLIVFDGVDAVPVKSKGVLYFGSNGAGIPAKVKGLIKRPDFVRAEDHPVLKGVDLESIYIETSLNAQPAGSGIALAEAKQGALVVVAEGKQRSVFVSFEPMNSDFPLNVGFPIFIGNSLDWLVGQRTSRDFAIKTGQLVSQDTKGTDRATLALGQSKWEITPIGGRYTIRDFVKVGTYKLQIGTESKTIYSYLRSPLESAIAPIDNLNIGQQKVRATSQLTRFEDLWKWIVAVGLLVLSFEWWYYSRRS